MKFCDVAKLGLFCDTYVPKTEKRRDEDVKVVSLTLRVEPLSVEIAAAIDPLLRRTLFRQQHPEPAPYMHEVTFALDKPRQQLHVYAASDTDRASILLDQVKIGRVRAKRGKYAWALLFKATFGPCDPKQLMFVQNWFGTQRFVTFDASEGELFDEQAEELEEEPVPEADGGELAPEAEAPAERRRTRRTH